MYAFVGVWGIRLFEEDKQGTSIENNHNLILPTAAFYLKLVLQGWDPCYPYGFCYLFLCFNNSVYWFLLSVLVFHSSRLSCVVQLTSWGHCLTECMSLLAVVWVIVLCINFIQTFQRVRTYLPIYHLLTLSNFMFIFKVSQYFCCICSSLSFKAECFTWRENHSLLFLKNHSNIVSMK